MASDAKDSGEESPIYSLRKILLNQKKLVDDLIRRLEIEKSQPKMGGAEVIRITTPMLEGLSASVDTVFRLTEAKDIAIRDVYGIARCLHELAVNICYIAATGREAALLAERHALQKNYRNLDRKGQLGGLQFNLVHTGRLEVSEVPGLAEALEEFTTKKGKEITEWSKEDISTRIEKVKELYADVGICLSGSNFSIYRSSSEILHGTYFGVYYFWFGSNGVHPSERPFSEIWDEHFNKIFWTTFFGTQGVLRLYATLLSMPELAKAQMDATDCAQDHIKKYARLSDGHGWSMPPPK